MTQMINYELVEQVIKDFELIFDKFKLDNEEKQLCIKLVNSRILADLQKQRTSDLVSGFGVGGFNLGKLMGRLGDEDGNR